MVLPPSLCSDMNLKTALRFFALGLLAAAFVWIIQSENDGFTPLIPSTELQKQLSEKDYEGALKTANQALRNNPQDLDALLGKGVALTGLKQRNEAISLYQKVTRDHPEQAEPFNNLAALYAAEGKYENARQVLEKAMQTQGSYAVAYKNLNAVYAKLADQAYSKALDVPGEKNTPPLQLSLISARAVPGVTTPVIAMSTLDPLPIQIASNTKKPTNPVPATVANPPLPPETKTASGEQIKVAVVTSTPGAASSSEKHPPKPPEKSTEKTSDLSSSPISAQKPTEKPVDKSPEKSPAGVDKTERDIENLVQAWAGAWSKQDIKAYLNFYASNFDPGNQSRAAWEADRRARIGGKARISVTVSNLAISVKSANAASVKFRQSYKSDRLNSLTSKTLVLERKGDGWRIVAEKAGG